MIKSAYILNYMVRVLGAQRTLSKHEEHNVYSR